MMSSMHRVHRICASRDEFPMRATVATRPRIDRKHTRCKIETRGSGVVQSPPGAKVDLTHDRGFTRRVLNAPGSRRAWRSGKMRDLGLRCIPLVYGQADEKRR
jgi:hypothetical protein